MIVSFSLECKFRLNRCNSLGITVQSFYLDGAPLKRNCRSVIPNYAETEDGKNKREHKLRSLNALCVRLVFLFYAEDSGIFERDQFLDYMEQFTAGHPGRH